MPTLNILLHGLFAVVEEPYRVVLAVPHVDDHDKYLLQLQGDPQPFRFGRGNYELMGVKNPPAMAAPPPCFPATKNARIGKGAAQPTEVFTTSPPAYATFIVPRPKQVYSCLCFNYGQDVVFVGQHATEITSKKFAMMNILAYDIDDAANVRFTGLPGFKAHYKPCSTEFVNMAIISRGPHADPPAVSTAFAKMMTDLIPGKDIQLFGLANNPPTTDPCDNIPGVDHATFIAFQPASDFFPDDCVGVVVNNA
jgi:hypothetical protein